MRQRPTLTSSDARKIVQACIAEARRNEWSATVAVVDDSGALLMLERMDTATPISAQVAFGKARTAALTRRPTKFWDDCLKERPALLTLPADVMMQGGLPLFCDGECVGAVGVSGVQSAEDEQVARAGAEALGSDPLTIKV